MPSKPVHLPKVGKYLEFMTWIEAEPLLARAPIVMIPVGAACKEHGHHLPLNNDLLIAEYLTRRVLDESPVIALPPVQYGHYPAFVEYPGSVNIGRETFRDTIVDICRSIHAFGPKKFYVL